MKQLMLLTIIGLLVCGHKGIDLFLEKTGKGLPASFYDQPVYPPCIQEKINNSKKESRGEFARPAKFLAKYKLAGGRSVFAFSLQRPQGCMDCPSGVYYVDSLCKTVADFMVGRAPRNYIDSAYTKEDFEKIPGNPLYKQQLKQPSQK